MAGLVTATWAVLVPYARANTGVNDATLGSLLLCLGIGALLTMPITGALTSRFGCRKVIIAALILIILVLPLLAVITQPILLGLALLLFGIGVGVTDCAINIQAILVEKASRVFVRNELLTLQKRFKELNEWAGEAILQFEPYT